MGEVYSAFDEELGRRLHGTEHVDYASTLNDAGVIAVWGSDFGAAKQIFGELTELDRRLYDPGHPNVASAISNLAAVLSQEGDLDAAEQRFQEVLEIRRRAHGEHHVAVGDVLLYLAIIAAKREQPVKALSFVEQARTIYGTSMDDDVPGGRPTRGFASRAPGGGEPYRRTAPKVGRNEPCSCGSGKKHKRCCGAAG